MASLPKYVIDKTAILARLLEMGVKVDESIFTIVGNEASTSAASVTQMETEHMSKKKEEDPKWWIIPHPGFQATGIPSEEVKISPPSVKTPIDTIVISDSETTVSKEKPVADSEVTSKIDRKSVV